MAQRILGVADLLHRGDHMPMTGDFVLADSLENPSSAAYVNEAGYSLRWERLPDARPFLALKDRAGLERASNRFADQTQNCTLVLKCSCAQCEHVSIAGAQLSVSAPHQVLDVSEQAAISDELETFGHQFPEIPLKLMDNEDSFVPDMVVLQLMEALSSRFDADAEKKKIANVALGRSTASLSWSIFFDLKDFGVEDLMAHRIIQACISRVPHHAPTSETLTDSSFAMCVGINYLRQANKTLQLSTCCDDARTMTDLFRQSFGVSKIKMLTDKHGGGDNPTAENIWRGLDWLVVKARAVPNSRIFFSFSGHGTQIKDKTGDEADGLDECIVSSDMQYMTDDELHRRFLSKLPASTTVLCVLDCCHSGTGFDLQWRYDSETGVSTQENRNMIRANVQMISGCQDQGLSVGVTGTKLRDGGALTKAFETVVCRDNGASCPTNAIEFLEAVHNELKVSSCLRVTSLLQSATNFLCATGKWSKPAPPAHLQFEDHTRNPIMCTPCSRRGGLSVSLACFGVCFGVAEIVFHCLCCRSPAIVQLSTSLNVLRVAYIQLLSNPERNGVREFDEMDWNGPYKPQPTDTDRSIKQLSNKVSAICRSRATNYRTDASHWSARELQPSCTEHFRGRPIRKTPQRGTCKTLGNQSIQRGSVRICHSTGCQGRAQSGD
eukprot:SAG11_NODE_352_length_10364_cov_17.751388_4_plen_665_part_00